MKDKEKIGLLLNTLTTFSYRYKETNYRNNNISETSNKNGSYPYIPFNMPWLYQDLIDIEKFTSKRKKDGIRPLFIDYGCGIGTTLAVARMFDYTCYGIEIHKQYIKDKVCTDYGDCFIDEGDLTNPDTFHKDKYDVVYFYSPFWGDEQEYTFEMRALDAVKISGFVIAPSPSRMGAVFQHTIAGGNLELEPHQLKFSKNFLNLAKKCKNFKKVGSHIYKRIR